MREPTGNAPHSLPAFGEAEPGTVLAEFDRRYAAGLAERKAARAAKRKALISTGVAMLRAISRGERGPRSTKPLTRTRGRYEHRPGHRRTATSRGPPDDGDGYDPGGDGDVLAPGVNRRAFSCLRAGKLRHVSVALDLFVEDTLPELYTFAEHRRRYGHLSPDGQLAAFLMLPEWQCQQAWRSLRFDIDRERGPPVVTSVRP
jgi:hypothetical protein